MDKKLFTIVLLLLFIRAEAQSSLLWEVSGKDGKQPSYLFGSFHLMCKNDFSYGPKLSERIRQSEQFYAELDLTQSNMQAALMQGLTLKGTTLSELMGSPDYEKARTAFKQITGMDLQLFNQFKPFMSLNLLALYAIPCADKIQPETLLFQMAREQNIPVAGLETLADQLAAIDAQPIESQLKTFTTSLQNYDSVKLVMKQLLQVYQLNNSDSLYQFMQQNNNDDHFEKELIEKRNQRWIPVMDQAIRNKATFFVVGAGHLGGNSGLIALLRKMGYTLKPLND
jgi:uncharacterized protein YbaP (TraB family)